MTLVETGTRALIGVVFGPTREGETDYARRLLHHLRPDMLVLWDKSFDANAFLAAVAGTGARFLGRIHANRRTPVRPSPQVRVQIRRNGRSPRTVGSGRSSAACCRAVQADYRRLRWTGSILLTDYRARPVRTSTRS
ncbi:hypothetical protein OHB49_13370 [Streptomyces sp. NBC_01717]